MKKIALLLFAGAALSLSCSNDDDTAPRVDSNNVYLPVDAGNYWVYNVSGSLQSGRDSLYVANDTVISAETYNKFKTKASPAGFYSGALNNNGVRKDGDKLLATGSASVNFSEDFPFTIAITDLVLFKESAAVNEELGRVTGSVNEMYDGVEFKLDYILTTTAKEDVASLTVSGEQFTDVKTVETKINLKISLVAIPTEVLPAQDVLISRQYYAKNVGVIKTDSHFTYTLDATLAGFLEIPATANETQQELLADYNAE
jgi:hypothetical protein